ncbi:MAG: radical SAM protein [Promethearchaeota archaeon]|nr:MAG: radical SAM protein [Candidatus Lokiarchaeota archaeon]
MQEMNKVFTQKTELLCKGLFLDNNLRIFYKNQGIRLDFGRKGGAGPLGGRYFLFENGTLVNVALWDDKKKTNLALNEKEGEYFKIIDDKTGDVFTKLKLLEEPHYYDPKYRTSDGVPIKKVALVHGVDCLASTIYQRCKYWACGEACMFCAIELSLIQDSTILEKKPEQMIEVIRVARKEGRCNHMTLTSGTEEGKDKGAKRYIELLREVKKNFPDLPLHVQIEPMEDFEYLYKLKEAGADTIGIHIEILNEKIRKIITPGKFHIPYSNFEANWKKAVEIFGKNQVETFILTGFGESFLELISEIKNVIALGVIPFITPVRSIPGLKELPQTDFKELRALYIEVAKLMKQYGLNPLENKAGCVKCGGCSAINEAYKVA